jgi:DNA-binding response OmpR family regulator
MAELQCVACVDDDPEMLMILEAVLGGDAGMDVRPFRSGYEALRSLANDPAQLVLLDVGMPRMDGLETAHLLRKATFGLTLPIAFLTGRKEPHDLDLYRRKGVPWIIPKPLDPAMLLLQVKAIWANSQQNIFA